MKSLIKRLVALHVRISTRLFGAIGASVALTVAASVVGLLLIARVDSFQKRVNEGSVPALGLAFSAAQSSGELVAAAPRLAAANPDDINGISTDIDSTYAAFDKQLEALQDSLSIPGRNQLVRGLGVTLRSQLDDIEMNRVELFRLGELKLELQSSLDVLRAEIDAAIVPALDDQFFYLSTGRLELGLPASSRAEHLSAQQLGTYRFLTELQANANISTQLLATAFGLTDVATIEPLRERFEASTGRISRSISQLGQGDPALAAEFEELFSRLTELGDVEGGGFALRASELELLGAQDELLDRSRRVAADLLANVNSLVESAQVEVTEATDASNQAIFSGRILLSIIAAVSIGGGLLIIVMVGRVLLRRLARLSELMRKMAQGNLELTADVGGRDEVADMAAALEVFRKHALEVQRLNLVEKMAGELQEKNAQLEVVLADLQRAQDQIVTREKLAALGELTAGVAHEIKNPLNFVKNFSEASEELLEEMQEILETVSDQLSDDHKSWMDEIQSDLSSNLEKIRTHGDRANRIVTDMLSMGRDTGEWQMADVNNLIEEHARLAYHSARAADSEFQLELIYDFGEDVGELRVIPRDLSRVFLNMVGNACDATDEKRRAMEELDDSEPFAPRIWLSTKRMGEEIEIRIKDNGNGIPEGVVDKIFNPFFTTKPTHRGTGLGLAISSDIVRQHGGAIEVDTKVGEYTEMLVTLPAAVPKDRTSAFSEPLDSAALD